MENGSATMAVPNSGDISSTGNVQQHFSVPSTGTQSAVSIIAQDPSKGVYIVDPSQQHTAAALQMFGTEQRLIAASANPVEISNPNTTTPAQTIMVCGFLVVLSLVWFLQIFKKLSVKFNYLFL